MCHAIKIRAALSSLMLLGAFVVLPGCDRMITQRKTQLSQDADAKVGEGNYVEAINLYEAALDGSASSADIHYKLALIYDDKMNDPLNALHHFKRFLTLTPTGKRAEEVKNFMKRDELILLTNLSGDSVVTRAEAVRLRNENLNLRKQIEERWTQNKAASAAEKAMVRAKSIQPNDDAAKTSDKARSYTVQRGDTLASISRKFYKTSSRWGKILDANAESLSKASDLKPGQQLTIP
jgi:tetratricopeptide (TPR) repeat protein